MSGQIADVMTPADFARDVLRVTPETERNYRYARPHMLPPHRRIGGRVIYLRADVEAWLAGLPQHRSTASAKAAHRKQAVVRGTADRRKQGAA